MKATRGDIIKLNKRDSQLTNDEDSGLAKMSHHYLLILRILPSRSWSFSVDIRIGLWAITEYREKKWSGCFRTPYRPISFSSLSILSFRTHLYRQPVSNATQWPLDWLWRCRYVRSPNIFAPRFAFCAISSTSASKYSSNYIRSA